MTIKTLGLFGRTACLLGSLTRQTPVVSVAIRIDRLYVVKLQLLSALRNSRKIFYNLNSFTYKELHLTGVEIDLRCSLHVPAQVK